MRDGQRVLWGWIGLCAACPVAASAREPADLGGLSIPSLSSPDCQAIAYQPVAAYDAPAGRRTGQLLLDPVPWARQADTPCEHRPQIQLAIAGQPTAALLTREIANEYAVPAVFARRTHSGTVWYQLRDDRARQVWVPAPAAQHVRYVSLESDLVQGLATMPETCTPQGHCTPSPSSLQALVAQAGAARPGCYGNAYDIVGPPVLLPGGRRAYRVSLAPELLAAWGRRLPRRALVPTYDQQVRWTGFFYPRGC